MRTKRRRKQQKKETTSIEEQCCYCQKVVKTRNGGMTKHLLHCTEKLTTKQVDVLTNQDMGHTLPGFPLGSSHNEDNHNSSKDVTTTNQNITSFLDNPDILSHQESILHDDDNHKSESSEEVFQGISMNDNETSPTRVNKAYLHPSNQLTSRLLNRAEVSAVLALDTPYETTNSDRPTHSTNLEDLLGTKIDLPPDYQDTPIEIESNIVAYATLYDFCLDKGCYRSFLDEFLVKYQDMVVPYDFKPSNLMGQKHKSILGKLNAKFDWPPPRKEQVQVVAIE